MIFLADVLNDSNTHFSTLILWSSLLCVCCWAHDFSMVVFSPMYIQIWSRREVKSTSMLIPPIWSRPTQLYWNETCQIASENSSCSPTAAPQICHYFRHSSATGNGVYNNDIICEAYSVTRLTITTMLILIHNDYLVQCHVCQSSINTHVYIISRNYNNFAE